MQFKLLLVLVLSGMAISRSAAQQEVARSDTNVSVRSAPLPMGWRNDGTGRFPDADPPTVWGKDKNVVWSTAMPGWSNATPVLVGDRIFVCAEPTTLLCVRAADGKILWQKTNSYMEMLSGEEVAAAKLDLKKGDEIVKQLDPLKKELAELLKQLRKTPKDEQLRAKAKQVRGQVKDLEDRLKALSKWRMPKTNDVNGYSSCTPTSDGQDVYVLFGTGVAACYDLEGNRKWIRLVQKPTQDYGQSASPLLVGDRLIVHINGLFALDTKTGQVVWTVKTGQRWGSPVHARIGGADVAITAFGDVLRVADGDVLARRLAGLEYCAPVVHEAVVYYIQHGGKAVKLPGNPGKEIDKRALWQTRPNKDRYYASPVCHDGLIYAINQKAVFSAIDAATGEVVYEQKLDLGKGTAFSSITLAGDYLFVSSDNGTTVVVDPGREYKEIARNTLEAFRSCPVFSGKRMYIRGLKNLYCIGQ